MVHTIEPSYLLAFTAGLVGGAHCVGMCGPIVASYALQGRPAGAPSPWSERGLPHLFYNVGRITTYAFIGALSGLSGAFLNSISGFRNITGVIAGLLMILMGVSITGLWGGSGWLERRSNLFMKAGGEIMRQASQWKYLILGSLMGFLPCGLSYSAFMASAGMGGLLPGMLLSLLFGLGTVPWLLLFGMAASFLSSRMKGVLYKTGGVVVIIMGVYFIVKGFVKHGHM